MNSSQVIKLPSAAYDNKIYAKFAVHTFEKKATNKEEFQSEFGLLQESKIFLLGFGMPLTEKSGADLLAKILPGIEALGIQLALLGIGTEKYQMILTEFAKENDSIVILENTQENMRKLYSASDAMLLLTDDTNGEQALKNMLSYGVVPLAKEDSSILLEDYNPNQEKGNSFLFPSYNGWQVFASLVRAIENYRFPYDWKNISREGMKVSAELHQEEKEKSKS